MNKINGYKINYDFTHFKKIADLIWYEGPLLAHYVNPQGEDYLFYWVDRDDKDNRWIVFRVNLPTLQLYIGKKITLRDLMLNVSDGYLFTVDIDNELQYHNIMLTQPSELPDNYVPTKESYYEFEPIPTEDAAELMTYELTIPYQEHSKLEQLLSHLGIPVSSLKKMVKNTAIF